MPKKKQDTVQVACPHCGHRQTESADGYSTNCKSCGGYFRVQDVLKPTRRKADRRLDQRRIHCLDCGLELHAPASAQSTMCKRCSSYLDLRDYRIIRAVSKNFKTVGTLAIELKGYVFNTESHVGQAIIKGRFLGKLVTQGDLILYSTAEISGTFHAGCLVIPATEHFRWKSPIKARSARIAGELVADLKVEDTIRLEATARLFGSIQARHLVIEEGAILTGKAKIGAIEERKPVPKVPFPR